MKDIFKNSTDAVGSAFKNVKKAFGIETDPDLRLYGTLNENDFSHIRNVYGEANLADYIQTMEAKRLKKAG